MQRLKSAWKGLPGAVRKPIALVVGFGLIVLGALLVVVPGPLTIPPMVAGLAVLSTEFDWAHKVLHVVKGRAHRSRLWFVSLWRRARNQA